MNNVEYLSRLLEPYEPQQPIDQLVEQINRLYHRFEAGKYDKRHPEIRQQLPAIWGMMIQFAEADTHSDSWDILDFGCGTGFASEQVLARVSAGRIRSLTCYDPSPEMLERCRKRLGARFPAVRTVNQLDELTQAATRFNVLLTNSVLHHLPDPLQSIGALAPHLTTGAIWLCGHEPSSRFFQNPECVSLYQRYEAAHRRQRYFRPRSYLRRLARAAGVTVDPASRAAAAAGELGLFRRRPSRELVSRLVDFHVACSAREAECGRGFDLRLLRENFHHDWELEWHQSYNFLGPVWEGRVGARWRAQCEDLQRRYSDDGANFCCIWRSKHTTN